MIAVSTPLQLFAHADIHERIAVMDKRIAETPGDPALYFKRGELYRLHREWDAALADYQKAAQLAPDRPDIDYYTGKLWLDRGRPELAKPALDRFLLAKPDHAGALVDRSRSLALLGKGRPAVEDLSKAIALFKFPLPTHYLDRARLLVAEGPQHVDEALRGIDEGVARLGPLVTLIQFAIAAETGRGKHQAALVRWQSLPAKIKNLPAWQVQRGEILAAAGRNTEARLAYNSALDAIDKLPTQRRRVPAIKALESRVRDLLARLQTPTE